MEELVSEGRVHPDDFEFLNTNIVYSHSDAVSTNLYPEWPFAALATTDPELKNQVAIGLLQSGNGSLAKAHGMEDVWSAPLPYHSVRELIDAYQARLKTSDLPRTGFNSSGIWALIALSFAGFALWWRRFRYTAPNLVLEDEANSSEKASLTQREHEVLALIARGKSSKEIAIDLGISPKTVEYHRANLLRKFGARTSSHLIAMAT